MPPATGQQVHSPGRRYPARAFAAVATLVTLALTGACCGLLTYTYDQAIRRAERTTGATAAALGVQVSLAVRTTDGLLAEMARDLTAAEQPGRLADRLHAAGSLGVLVAADAEGRVLVASDPAWQGQSAATRTWFNNAKALPREAAIGTPEDSGAGPILPYARAAVGADGRVTGVTAALLGPRALLAGASALAAGLDLDVRLYRRDGPLLAVASADAVRLVGGLAQPPYTALPTGVTAAPWHGEFEGAPVIAGFVPVVDTTLVVEVAQSRATALAGFRAEATFLVPGFALALAVSLGSLGLAWRSAQAKRQEDVPPGATGAAIQAPAPAVEPAPVVEPFAAPPRSAAPPATAPVVTLIAPPTADPEIPAAGAAPAAEPAPTSPLAAAGPPASPLHGMRVLLAEDNATNQMVIKAILQRTGATVEIAVDGGEAVASWRRGGFDVVLMDMQMPGIDGLQATRAIRAAERAGARDGSAGRRQHIIGLTAAVGPEFERECIQAGMDGYLGKPVGREALVRALAAAVGAATP